MTQKDTSSLDNADSAWDETLGSLSASLATPTGRVPFGFRQGPYGRTICELETKWLQRIHALAAHRYSSEQIARILNKEDRKSKRAGKWTRTAVWRILQKFKEQAVTKSFCNDSSETLHSVTPPTVASKAPSDWIRTNSSTENVKPQNLENPKALQINDFQRELPEIDTKQIGTEQSNAFIGLKDGSMVPNGLTDESLFGRVNGARGRARILFPLEAAAVMSRQRRYQPPKPPAIQKLLEKAYQLNEMMAKAGINRFTLSKNLGLDPSRITQILNLLRLDAKIQDYIRNLPPTKRHDPIGDRQWMRLARIRELQLQLKEFDDLLSQSFQPALAWIGQTKALSGEDSTLFFTASGWILCRKSPLRDVSMPKISDERRLEMNSLLAGA